MCRKLSCLIYFVLVLCIVGTSTAQNIDPSLVGWWTFDDGSGTVAKDMSGKSVDAVLTGNVSWGQESQHGGILLFDGSLDAWEYVFIDGLFTVPVYTITVWFRVDGTTGDHQDVLSAYAPGVVHGILLEVRSDGVLRYLHRYPLGTGGGTNIYTTTTFVDGAWYHAAMVKSVDTIALYINGELVDSAADTSEFNPGDTFGIALGILDHERAGADKRLLLGAMDDVRIYDRVMSQEEIQAIMEAEQWPYAWGPIPADGALHPGTWVNLGWLPGPFAVSHDVYFGDNFDDVNDGAEGAFQGNQTATFLVAGFPGFSYPDGLVPGTTYYWRIDEVNDANPNSPWKGDVWSFLVPPKIAYEAEPVDGAKFVDPDAQLSWTPGYGAKLHTIYFGDNFDDVDNAAGGLPQGVATYTPPGTLKMAKTYYWRVDEFDVIDTHKGAVWSFTTEGAVGSPDPANGAVDVKQTPNLSWTPGVYADSHQVYFGADKEAVKNADTSSPEYKGAGDFGAESYEPEKLEWNTTYYWRIDEANNVNPDSPWTGNLWSFTTANFLVVDDFESYNDIDPPDPNGMKISPNFL